MANESLSDKFSELSEREKKMVIAMAVIMPLLAMVLVIGIFSNSLNSIEDQTRSYQQSLDLVRMAGPSYLKHKQASSQSGGLADIFTDKVLEDNPVKLTGFIAARANEAGVNPSSYDTEDIPIGSKSGDKSGPIIVEKKVKVDIRQVQIDDLLKFLEGIESSDQPVVIKRIDLRGRRRKPGEVRARVEVSTFIKKKQKS